MKLQVLNQKGEKVKDITLSNIFDKEVSKEAIALYIDYLRNALRDPIANSKDRSDVSGGGKKPHKQKGTGRARQGSSRSPLWVGGGVTFGPTSERNFKKRINKNFKKNVILGILGNIIRDKKAIAIENLSLDAPKTKDAVNILSNIKAEGKITVLFDSNEKNAEQSFRNLAGVIIGNPGRIDIINLLSSNNLVITEEAIKKIEEIYNK